ncbi:hypothetical protein CRUP_033744 [Coryphaenoides rupestris]|nr:hypothetical protein CRUP_033744 [Coryphaenoides rupestris]
MSSTVARRSGFTMSIQRISPRASAPQHLRPPAQGLQQLVAVLQVVLVMVRPHPGPGGVPQSGGLHRPGVVLQAGVVHR